MACAGWRPLKGEDFAVEGSLVGPLRPFGPPPPEGPFRGRTLAFRVGSRLEGALWANVFGQPRPSRSERERQRTKRRIWCLPIDLSSPRPIDTQTRQPARDQAPAVEPCEPSSNGSGPVSPEPTSTEDTAFCRWSARLVRVGDPRRGRTSSFSPEVVRLEGRWCHLCGYETLRGAGHRRSHSPPPSGGARRRARSASEAPRWALRSRRRGPSQLEQ